MLAMTTDHFARETGGERQAFRPGVAIEASQDELDAEALRRYPRLVVYVPQSSDELLDQELLDLSSCDRTADAMLAQLEGQRFREGFEASLAGVRVSTGGFGRGEMSGQDAVDRLTGGGRYAEA